MSRRPQPSAAQWEAMCDEGIAAFERLRRDGPEVFRRSRISARGGDGYPTSVRLGASSRASLLDDDGMPVPPVADRVGELVVLQDRRDPLRDSAAAMNDRLLDALRSLRAADGARARAFPPPPPDVDPAADSCVVHARYGIFAVVLARGRCRFCYDWAREHDFADPSEEDIRALEERRIRRQARRSA